MRVSGLTSPLAVHTLWLGLLACSPGTGGDTTPGGNTGSSGTPSGTSGAGGGVGTTGGTGDPGNPGTAGGAGVSPSGGATANAGTGVGGQPFIADGGRGGALVLLRPTGGQGGAEACSELSVIPKPVVPTVLILVDNSSSMFEPRETLWDLLYTTLMHPTNGVVKPLEDQVRFGFASFKGSTMPAMENEAACASITSVPYGLNNHQAIDTVYTQLGTQWSPGTKWETPTGHAINRVAATLASEMPDPPGPKYILLVTDGNPNTCQILDPQCGQDLSIEAVQDAKAQGIGTFVIGIGDIVSNNSGCEAVWGRCGVHHLQDLANAGLGLAVAAPPGDYQYQPCPSAYDQMLRATYAPAGEAAGSAPYFTATNAAELKTSLEDLLKAVVSCTFDMDAIVTGNPSLGSILVGTEAATYNDANGWRLEDNKYQVTLQGAACESFRSGDHTLNISFPCDPVTGLPIAVKR